MATSIRPERGRKNPAKDNLYKSWLKHAFKLGLYTGGRSEDIVQLKWNDIIQDAKGNFDTLKTIDYKIDRANSHRTSKNERFEKYFTITKELGDLLKEMGYDLYKGCEKFIIAPEDNLKRSTIAALISRAFSHYYKQLNTEKEIKFKNLRKTYITSALSQFGESSTALTNHRTIAMSDKHYHDKEYKITKCLTIV
jgi:integrase